VLDRVRHAGDEERLHGVVFDVGFHRGAIGPDCGLARRIENRFQYRRVARAIKKQSRTAEHEIHRAPDRVAIAKRLVPTVLRFLLTFRGILPTPSRGGFYRLRRDAALVAELEQCFSIGSILRDIQHREVVWKQYRVEREAPEAFQMHRGNSRSVPGNADEAHEPLRPRLDQRFERASGSECGFPLLFIDEIVHLDQIDVVNAQSFERAMHTVARAAVGSIAGLGSEEEALAMLAHPRANSQLGLAVRRGRVDMIDAVLEQRLEHRVRLRLVHRAQRGGAEDDSRALMTGLAECTCLNHDAPPLPDVVASLIIAKASAARNGAVRPQAGNGCTGSLRRAPTVISSHRREISRRPCSEPTPRAAASRRDSSRGSHARE
jgi:hypothetical protein